jgi:tetratricopeptide (TPR) repeat protein
VAYDFYLRGRSYLRQRQFEYALAMYEEAVKLDPNFALSYAGIAHVWGGMHEFRSQSPEFVERGLAACAKAEWLAADLPEVLSARARIQYAQQHYDESIRLARRAIDSGPNAKEHTMSWAAPILPPSAMKRPCNSRKVRWKS